MGKGSIGEQARSVEYVEFVYSEGQYLLFNAYQIIALSEKVYEASSEQRKSLHLAAVFTCNFTNHMYVLAAELLKKYGLPFEAMLPLIDETARKVHELEPLAAQTGPAVRYDENVIDEHLRMLADEPQMLELYREISENIHRLAIR